MEGACAWKSRLLRSCRVDCRAPGQLYDLGLELEMEDVLEAVAEIDQDGDGNVSIKEFISLLHIQVCPATHTHTHTHTHALRARCRSSRVGHRNLAFTEPKRSSRSLKNSFCLCRSLGLRPTRAARTPAGCPGRRAGRAKTGWRRPSAGRQRRHSRCELRLPASACALPGPAPLTSSGPSL